MSKRLNTSVCKLTVLWIGKNRSRQLLANSLYRLLWSPTFDTTALSVAALVPPKLISYKKLQKRAARMMTNSSFDAPSRPLIEELEWKTVDELITSESKTMVFKSLNEQTPQYLCDVLTWNSLCSSYSLRNTWTDLRLPIKKSTNGQKYFSYRCAKLWNSLSVESKQATSQYNFKNYLETETFSFRFYCRFSTLLYIRFKYCSFKYCKYGL